MSISNIQATQAKMFLSSYLDALKTLEQTARIDKQKNNYNQFLSQVISWQNNPSLLNKQLIRKITMFQYSHYYYLKNFKDLGKIDQINFVDFKKFITQKTVTK